MQTVASLFSSVSTFYKTLNPSTLSGAIDIIVIQNTLDSTLTCSPFHVRFGKIKLLTSVERQVEVRVNEQLVDVKMKMGEAGEAFFVVQVEGELEEGMETSPVVRPSDVAMEEVATFRLDEEEEEGRGRGVRGVVGELLKESRVDGLAHSLGNEGRMERMLDEHPFSDTEVELKEEEEKKGKNRWSWGWGRLPVKREGEELSPHMQQKALEEEDANDVKEEEQSIVLSLCGPSNLSNFNAEKVEFELFDSDPDLILKDPRLVIKLNGNSEDAAKLLIAQNAFNKNPTTMPTPLKQQKRGFKHYATAPRMSSEGGRRFTGGLRNWWSKREEEGEEQIKPMDIQSDRLSVSPQNVYFSDEERLPKPPASTPPSSRTATCYAKLFYWKDDVQLIVSDIDGTITKSDALGHLFTFVGKDWTHSGVASLYTNITRNGYKIMYLTSRAIGQASSTRSYLEKVEQGQYQLPDGPVLLSPDRLLTSLHREVIMRKPEIFKIACLRDIAQLFKTRSDPFYAGFGNRITDAFAYRSVGILASRIFTINSNGDVRLELLESYKSSYVGLCDDVDHFFPPVQSRVNQAFNDWNYWKVELPVIDQQ